MSPIRLESGSLRNGSEIGGTKGEIVSQARSSRAPLTGVAFFVLIVASFVVAGESPDTESSGSEITSYFSGEVKPLIATILLALSAIFLLFFVGVLRGFLRSRAGSTEWLSTVAFGGGVVAATGILLFAGLSFTLIDASDTLDPAATQAINALSFDLFFPLAGGLVTLLVATSLSSLRTNALPVWLVWAGIVIAIASFTPIGFFAFLASLLWILVVSIVLATRNAKPVESQSSHPA